MATPAGARLSTGRTRYRSDKVLWEPPKQLVQLGPLLYLHQVRQLPCNRNICIQVAQAKAMNLRAPLSHCWEFVPRQTGWQWTRLKAVLAPGVVNTNPLNRFPFFSRCYDYLKSYYYFHPSQILHACKEHDTGD